MFAHNISAVKRRYDVRYHFSSPLQGCKTDVAFTRGLSLWDYTTGYTSFRRIRGLAKINYQFFSLQPLGGIVTLAELDTWPAELTDTTQ